MAQHARTRLATTNRKNARQARSRRESPCSVAAVCGRKGSCPRVTRRGAADAAALPSARRQNVNFFVGSRVVAVAILFVVGLSLGVCVLYGRPRRAGCPGGGHWVAASPDVP